MTAPRGAIPDDETTRRVFTALTVAAGRYSTMHSVANTADGPRAIIHDTSTHLLPIRGNPHLDLLYEISVPSDATV